LVVGSLEKPNNSGVLAHHVAVYPLMGRGQSRPISIQGTILIAILVKLLQEVSYVSYRS